jgi:hypothetical protein
MRPSLTYRQAPRIFFIFASRRLRLPPFLMRPELADIVDEI